MNTEPSKTKAVIVIPTYTNTEGLRRTLDSLKALHEYRERYKVLVVNNNANNPLNDLPQLDPSNILTEKKNVGFAKACNDGTLEGIRLYDPEYIVYLNDDVTFDRDWISMCIDDMKKHGWSAAAPVLKKPDGSIENLGYRVLPQGRVELETEPAGGGPIDGITAAAMVITREAFDLTDGFDETFFAYLEDVDFCLRLKRAGKTFGVTGSTFVTHEGQQTSKHMSFKKARLDYRNWTKIINRHWSDGKKIKYAGPILMERLRNLSGILKAK